MLEAALDSRKAFELLTEFDDHYRSFALDYRDGPRYPDLERDAARKDLLSTIGAPKFKDR